MVGTGITTNSFPPRDISINDSDEDHIYTQPGHGPSCIPVYSPPPRTEEVHTYTNIQQSLVPASENQVFSRITSGSGRVRPVPPPKPKQVTKGRHTILFM